VLVTWSTPAETAMLTDQVLGRAGPRSFSAHGDRELRWVSGTAVFNGPALDAMLAGGDEAKVQAVLLHELGHLVGLGHVRDPYQVMFDTNAYPVSAYRAGDLRGLAALGSGRCYPDY
jgi:predicted Zn-dependent protease